jgi:hypothetical protein
MTRSRLRCRLRAAAAVLLVASAATVPAHEGHDDKPTGLDPASIGSASVRFATTCRPAVQADFNQAVALLHSFWFSEATRAFEDIGRRDPGCAVAWWGLALSQWGNPFGGLKPAATIERGRASVAAGLAAGRPSRRERALLTAVGHLYRDADPATQPARLRDYVGAMGALAAAHPKDDELQIFHALAVTQAALPTDKSYALQLQAADTLERLFARLPDHPGLAHYLIHAYDVPPLAPRALAAARRYASLAPAVPHALHMPSHTFTRVGAWAESIATNRRSADTAHANGEFSDELHALDYLAYAYLQQGRDAEAAAVAERASQVVAAATAAGKPVNAFAVAAIPARIALERGDWAAAAAVAPDAKLAPNAAAIPHFARAYGAARAGRPAEATADLARLAELRDRLAAGADAYWAGQVETQRRVALAWQLQAEGRGEAALAELAAAADAEERTDKAAVTPGPFVPARESQAELLLLAGRAADAQRAAEAVLAYEPNRLRTLAVAARAAVASGDAAAARRHAAQLFAVAGAPAVRPDLAGVADALLR